MKQVVFSSCVPEIINARVVFNICLVLVTLKLVIRKVRSWWMIGIVAIFDSDIVAGFGISPHVNGASKYLSNGSSGTDTARDLLVSSWYNELLIECGLPWLSDFLTGTGA